MKEHTDFAFTESKINFSAGSITGSIYGKLRGSMKNIDNKHSSSGTPYELLVWFLINKPKETITCKLVLNEITLKNVERNLVIPISPTFDTKFTLKSDGNYIASMRIKKMELEYVTHELSFRYSLGGDCFEGSHVNKVRFEFYKDFQKRDVSFWDSLMGV